MNDWFFDFRNERLNTICDKALDMENRLVVMLNLCDSKVMPPIEWFFLLRRNCEEIMRELMFFVKEENRDEVKEAFSLLRGEIDKSWDDFTASAEFKPELAISLLAKYSKFLGFINTVFSLLADEIKRSERDMLGSVVSLLVGIEKKPKVRKVGVPIQEEGA